MEFAHQPQPATTLHRALERFEEINLRLSMINSRLDGIAHRVGCVTPPSQLQRGTDGVLPAALTDGFHGLANVAFDLICEIDRQTEELLGAIGEPTPRPVAAQTSLSSHDPVDRPLSSFGKGAPVGRSG